MRTKLIGLTCLLAVLPIVVWLFMTHTTPIAQAANSAAPNVPPPPVCQAVVNNGVTDSSVYTTVQAAIDAASAGNLVKVTGYCAGTIKNYIADQVAYLNKTLTLRGGYNPGDWTTIDPIAYLTTLDAFTGTYAIWIESTPVVTIENFTLARGKGTVIDIESGTVNISNTTVMSGTFGGIQNGQGSFSGGTLTVINSTLTRNGYSGLKSNGSSTLYNTIVISNDFGLQSSSGTMHVISSTFAHNGTYGIINGADLVLSNSTVISNGDVGFFMQTASLDQVFNSTIVDNGGNGILNSSGVTLSLVNSTVAKNHLNGILNDATLILSNTTVAGNVSGGVVSRFGTAYFRNTLVTQNPGGNCAASTGTGHNISRDYNLSSDNTGCGFTKTHDLKNVAAPIGPLQNNGGNTSTMMPLLGNSAIDHGACDFATDQRGQPRPDSHSPNCDIGAVEYDGVIFHVYLPLGLKSF